MKITVGTSSASVYSLIDAGLETNHSQSAVASADITDQLNREDLSNVFIENNGSETIYLERAVDATVAGSVSIGTSSPDNVVSFNAGDLNDYHLIAGASNSDVKVIVTPASVR